jgi:hypothetical protein
MAATLSAGQDNQAELMSPEKALNLAMINDGFLFTLPGWKKAALLFELPSPIPRDMLIYVTTRQRPFGKIQQQGNRMEFDEMWVDPLGIIDSGLRYKPSPQGELEGTIFLYRLVLSGEKWEPTADRQQPGESAGAQEWKIEGALKVREVAVDAAIRCVTTMRDQASNPEIKKNADKTLAILKQPRSRGAL